MYIFKKNTYINKLIENSDNRHTSRIWDVIKNRHPKSHDIQSMKVPNTGKEETNPQEIANTLNNHFTDLSNYLTVSDSTSKDNPMPTN